MVTRSSGASHMGSPSRVPNASWKASMFLTTWLQRNSLGECGSEAVSYTHLTLPTIYSV